MAKITLKTPFFCEIQYIYPLFRFDNPLFV